MKRILPRYQIWFITHAKNNTELVFAGTTQSEYTNLPECAKTISKNQNCVFDGCKSLHLLYFNVCETKQQKRDKIHHLWYPQFQ